MKRLLLAAALLAVTPAVAQTPEPGPSIQALQAQRNTALDWHAQAVAEVERLRAEVARLKTRLEQLEKPEK